MNKLMMVAVVVGCALSGVCADGTKTNVVMSARDKKAALKEAREEFLRETGGFVIKEDKNNGCVLVANAQKRIPAAKIKSPIGYMRVHAKMAISMRDVDAAAAANPGAGSAKALGATVVLFIKDDPNCKSTILVSPDERWGFVNLAALNVDEPGDEVLADRICKATNRALCFLLGSGGSRFPNTLVGAFRNGVKDYERFANDGLPPDVFASMASYLNGIGVRPVVRATYRKACEQGWAPQPTNDCQRAIWKEVHTLPSKPLKLEK